MAWIPYEGSRGCWWGEKHHCTFCGINGQGMVFCQKSADRVIAELRQITGRRRLRRICMVDNIMFHRFLETLMPRLGEEVPGLHLFYEQKANLTLRRLRALKRAGVAIVQPGIEALSSRILRLMDKGVTAPQNTALLRYARSVQLDRNWNLRFGFPGDETGDYYETLSLLPRSCSTSLSGPGDGPQKRRLRYCPPAISRPRRAQTRRNASRVALALTIPGASLGELPDTGGRHCAGGPEDAP